MVELIVMIVLLSMKQASCGAPAPRAFAAICDRQGSGEVCRDRIVAMEIGISAATSGRTVDLFGGAIDQPEMIETQPARSVTQIAGARDGAVTLSMGRAAHDDPPGSHPVRSHL